ncbi:MAG TPA: threonine ammonia-lyase, biosynthetic, partial [Steroidobacteraceae bacterium]
TARENCTERTLVAINGGANKNFDRLRYVSERADIGAQREALFAVQMPEEPGSFLRFCELLGTRSVTEFNYRYSDVKAAQVFVSLSLTQGKTERDALLRTMTAAGFSVRDMTDNEMAKLHVRYMVGGHARGLADERLYRFEFPERPGALLKFLQAIGTQWNVSLFHYRNHGGDHGRVLAGIQVPAQSATDFLLHINELQYAFTEETDNAAYRLFLGA